MLNPVNGLLYFGDMIVKRQVIVILACLCCFLGYGWYNDDFKNDEKITSVVKVYKEELIIVRADRDKQESGKEKWMKEYIECSQGNSKLDTLILLLKQDKNAKSN